MVRETVRENKVNIPPIYGEDYDVQWGKIDYNGKVVLDVGGDYGSTADYFLRKGAILVVNVDSNLDFINKCKEFRKQSCLPIIPIQINVDSAESIAYLVRLFQPDVLKSDCEGCESFIFDLDDDVFKMINEYIIEVHSEEIFNKMKNKCSKCEYDIIDVNAWAGVVKIVYCRKKV